LPNVPRYGYVVVFTAIFLNNIGLPLPGEVLLLGAGFILGKATGSLWQSMAAGATASFLGAICAFWMGRRLGQAGLEKIRWLHLTPKALEWPQRHFERHGAKAVFAAGYMLIGYVLGKEWKIIESWLGPIALYPIVTAIIVIAPVNMFRPALSAAFQRHFAKKELP
jgi:membrane protein DedA with SNARE-associated domain